METYPREWFRASIWSKEPSSEVIFRETEFYLYPAAGGRRRAKVSSHDCWFATQAEAQAWIDRRSKSEADKKALDYVRRAAPDLLEALKTARDYVSDAAKGALTYEGSGDGFIAMATEDLARLDAALAKARGQS